MYNAQAHYAMYSRPQIGEGSLTGGSSTTIGTAAEIFDKNMLCRSVEPKLQPTGARRRRPRSKKKRKKSKSSPPPKRKRTAPKNKIKRKRKNNPKKTKKKKTQRTPKKKSIRAKKSNQRGRGRDIFD